MPKITPFLWFGDQAEQAARFYTSIFKNSRITDVVRYGDAGPGEKGTVMTVGFELDGQEFTALNGGREFEYTLALSLVVHCATQAEVDELWQRLSEGGEPNSCGWLKDKFGVSWQIVPDALLEMLKDKDERRTQRVMQAMFPMHKLDIAALRAAYDSDTAPAGTS
ncbi:MAG: VOC family protein [Candidatus Eremiobacteraeota bacterium]|nr:VOC family protein [Candidatus Eremiobacteraeota bacterium]MBV8365592.1 VOC family protein [Candidatus Eremiobacteraeota bacterium]